MIKTFLGTMFPDVGSLIGVEISACFMNRFPLVALNKILSKTSNLARGTKPDTDLRN
jgi:hypothetical protein